MTQKIITSLTEKDLHLIKDYCGVELQDGSWRIDHGDDLEFEIEIEDGQYHVTLCETGSVIEAEGYSDSRLVDAMTKAMNDYRDRSIHIKNALYEIDDLYGEIEDYYLVEEQ